MEKENERAEEMGYKSPICDSKEETDTNFNLVTTYILDHLETISLFVGTHNEESSYLLMELMKERGIPHNDPRIWFGQLFGCCKICTLWTCKRRDAVSHPTSRGKYFSGRAN
jgi:proline dehydrogenase